MNLSIISCERYSQYLYDNATIIKKRKHKNVHVYKILTHNVIDHYHTILLYTDYILILKNICHVTEEIKYPLLYPLTQNFIDGINKMCNIFNDGNMIKQYEFMKCSMTQKDFIKELVEIINIHNCYEN